MRRIQLLLALVLPGTMGGTDVSGTWIGTWQRQGESQRVCLYLLQGDKALQGRIAYRHDTRVSSIDARLPVGDVVEFTITDEEQGIVNLRLTPSETPSIETVLTGLSTAGS